MDNIQKDSLTRWLVFFSTFILIGAGLLVVSFASQAVAERIGLDAMHFAYRQMAFAILAIGIIITLSRVSPKIILSLAVILYVGAIIGIIATLLFGATIKGATRWINIAGVSIQPSEFLKPALAILVAAIFASQDNLIIKTLKAGFITALGIGLLILQPDVGMSALLMATFLAAGFIAGWSFYLVGFGIASVVGFGIGAYHFLPHARSRIDRFLDPSSGDTYQVSRSFDAIANGGTFGVGLGEGRFRDYVPDVHADFIFAAFVEESGLLGGLLILAAFCIIVIGGLILALKAKSQFVMIGLSVLSLQIFTQAFINLGSTLGTIPTKGMALPLVSYGGSAILSAAIAIGFILALSRDTMLERRKLIAPLEH